MKCITIFLLLSPRDDDELGGVVGKYSHVLKIFIQVYYKQKSLPVLAYGWVVWVYHDRQVVSDSTGNFVLGLDYVFKL